MEPLTPEEIRGADFSIALRGYDRREVEAFLQDVAEEMADLKETSARSYQAAGEQLGELLQQSKDVADKLLLDAQNEAATLLQKAAAEAAGIREDADVYAKEVREQVDAEAESSRAHADQQYAERIRSADGKVRELSVAENEARQRISALRVELEKVAKRLLQSSTDGSSQAETQPSLEEQTGQLDREYTVPQDAVPAPPLGST
jgi:cell division initiation protein